jgi:hypothetical protein
VIVENASGRAIGSSRCYDWNPADESVVIGYTYLGARFDREEMVPVGGVPSARMIYRVDRSSASLR